MYDLENIISFSVITELQEGYEAISLKAADAMNTVMAITGAALKKSTVRKLEKILVYALQSQVPGCPMLLRTAGNH